jgi:hypothetical protein
MLRIERVCANGRQRGGFLAGGTKQEIVQFMKDMQTKKGPWWKGVQEVWFNKGAAVQ